MKKDMRNIETKFEKTLMMQKRLLKQQELAIGERIIWNIILGRKDMRFAKLKFKKTLMMQKRLLKRQKLATKIKII